MSFGGGFAGNLMIDVDVLIVGGGLVGSTLAAALSGTGISIALVDSTDLYSAINSEFDGRSFAVSLASHRLLSGVGIGQHLGEDESPIRDIRISDGPSLMFLHFDHRDAGGQPMGYMIENHSLRRAQYKRLIKAKDLILRSPDSVVCLDRNAYGVTAELASGARLKAKLLVAADGRGSRVRSGAGIGVTKWLRRLTPVELERLNGFPDNHTEGVTDGYRAFFMGNALVCGIVKRIGDNIE